MIPKCPRDGDGGANGGQADRAAQLHMETGARRERERAKLVCIARAGEVAEEPREKLDGAPPVFVALNFRRVRRDFLFTPLPPPSASDPVPPPPVPSVPPP